MGESCWQLEGTVARLAVGDCRAVIDLTRPAQGLALRVPGAPDTAAAWQILGVQFDDGPSVDTGRLDAYVRGDDLVATYDEVPPRRVRAQIYWRRLQAAEFAPQFAEHVAAALELIVSANTSLLDSDPQSSVVSTLPAACEILNIDGVASEKLDPSPLAANNSAGAGRGFLFRPSLGELSYVEIVHPADIDRSQIDTTPGDSPVKLIHHLFQQRLEKGVILRARVRAALVARRHDEPAARAAYEHFASAEPPLTV